MDNSDMNGNLVSVGDRLRQNSAKRTTGSGAEHAAAKPETAAVRNTLVSDAAVRREQENRRAQNELSCRICRDCAELEAEIELMDGKRREIAALKELFDRQAAELQKLDSNVPEASFGRSVDLIRIEYFRLCGRRETILSDSEKQNVSAASSPQLSLRDIRFAAMVIAGAILGTGCIVSLALSMIFS